MRLGRDGTEVTVIGTRLQNPAFFAAVRDYTARGAHGVVEPFDLVNAFARQGVAVDDVIDAWVNHPELPECP